MSVVDGMAIAAAERIERTGGPRAGLYAWRKLADGAGSAELRGAAILSALGCAVALSDAASADELARLWSGVDEGVWDERIVGVCKELARAGMLAAATLLAEAEAQRGVTARSLYLFARLLDVTGDPRAPAAFSDAISRAEKEGAREVVRASRVRRVAWLARTSATLGEAIEEAKRVDTSGARAEERLVIARVLLSAPSRFTRASGLGLLDDLVVEGGPQADQALRLAARHADDQGAALSPLEIERLRALMGRERIAARAQRAREALDAIVRLAGAGLDDEASGAVLAEVARAFPDLGPLHRRARMILAGRVDAEGLQVAASPTSPSSPAPWSALLDVVLAMRDAAQARGAQALRALRLSAPALPRETWTIAQAALVARPVAHDEPDRHDQPGEAGELRLEAAALVEKMLAASTSSPPRGWLDLSLALAAARRNDLATHALRRAAAAHEPGGTDAFALSLTRAGWDLAREGQRAKAIALLREARALALRPGASPSR